MLTWMLYGLQATPPKVTHTTYTVTVIQSSGYVEGGFIQGKDLGDGHRPVPQLVLTFTRTDQNQTAEEIIQEECL